MRDTGRAAAATADRIGRLNTALVRIAQSPDVRERLAALGVDPQAGSPDDFTRFIAGEIIEWTKIIKASGARID